MKYYRSCHYCYCMILFYVSVFNFSMLFPEFLAYFLYILCTLCTIFNNNNSRLLPMVKKLQLIIYYNIYFCAWLFCICLLYENLKSVVVVLIRVFCVKLSTYLKCLFAVDHRLVYLRPVYEDDNTYINAVSVHVSGLFLYLTVNVQRKCHITVNW